MRPGCTKGVTGIVSDIGIIEQSREHASHTEGCKIVARISVANVWVFCVGTQTSMSLLNRRSRKCAGIRVQVVLGYELDKVPEGVPPNTLPDPPLEYDLIRVVVLKRNGPKEYPQHMSGCWTLPRTSCVRFCPERRIWLRPQAGALENISTEPGLADRDTR